MSVKTVRELLEEQNKKSEDFTSELQSLNASFIKFFNAQNSREKTERLKDSEKKQDEKGFFAKLKDKFSFDRKSGKGRGIGGLSGAMETGSKLFTRSLFAVGGLFLADVIVDFFEGSLGSIDNANLVQRILKGAALGMIFGKKSIILGAILGAFNTPEVRAELSKLGAFLKESGIGPAVMEFATTTLLGGLQALNALTQLDFAGFFSNITDLGLVIGGLFLALSPLKTLNFLAAISGLKKLFSLLKAGVVSLVGMKAAAKLAAGPVMPASVAAGRGLKGLASQAGTKVTGALASTAKAGIVAGSLGLGVLTNGNAAKVASSAASGVGSAVSGASNVAKGVGGAVSGLAGKATLATGLKSVPILGALAGIGFGVNSLMKGDPVAAGLHVASGFASIIPGVGTAASVGLSGAAVARDMGYLGGGSDVGKPIPETGATLNDSVAQSDQIAANNIIMNAPVNMSDNSVRQESNSLFGLQGDTYDTRDPTMFMRGLAI